MSGRTQACEGGEAVSDGIEAGSQLCELRYMTQAFVLCNTELATDSIKSIELVPREVGQESPHPPPASPSPRPRPHAGAQNFPSSPQAL